MPLRTDGGGDDYKNPLTKDSGAATGAADDKADQASDQEQDDNGK
ncbi:hypothetical protein [Bradyrhizobium diazoefficiens]